MTATRYYHGGPEGLEPGDRIEPAVATGAPTAAGHRGVPDGRYDSSRVYVASSPWLALLFTGYSHRPRGAVYEVRPEGKLEVDPTYAKRPPGLAWVAEGAVVLARVRGGPTPAETRGLKEMARGAVERLDAWGYPRWKPVLKCPDRLLSRAHRETLESGRVDLPPDFIDVLLQMNTIVDSADDGAAP